MGNHNATGHAAKTHNELGVYDEVFSLGRVVGRGGFGKVYAVKRTKSPSHAYAVKVLEKRKLAKKKMVQTTISEGRLLRAIEYPLIVNLRGCWQTEDDLCMLFDLMLGGDLRYHLAREIGRASCRERV